MATLGTYLTIDGAAAAIDYYKAAFGAEEVMRAPAPEHGGKLMHAELKVFGQTLYMSDELDDYASVRSPKTLGGTSFNLIVTLEKPDEVDAALAKAEAAGGTITMPAADQFWGDRFGMLRDPFGHMWAFNAPKA